MFEYDTKKHLKLFFKIKYSMSLKEYNCPWNSMTTTWQNKFKQKVINCNFCFILERIVVGSIGLVQ